MTIEEKAEQIRKLITKNLYPEVFEQLKAYFKDAESLDELALIEADYNDLESQKASGTIEAGNFRVEMNRLKKTLLQFTKARAENLSYKQAIFKEHNATRKIRVFFSVANPHNDVQKEYIKHVGEYFEKKGITLQTLVGWDDDDPLIPIMEDMKAASGCLVLALERNYVVTGIEKRGSKQESMISNIAFTSPWLHIEAALARAHDLPLIILKPTQMQNEGLIHNEKFVSRIIRLEKLDPKDLDEYPIKGAIQNWIKEVKTFHKKKSKTN
jgi:hypothetical protein